MRYGGAGGLYPVGGVVLLVGFARVTSEPGVLSNVALRLPFGQGGYAALSGCLIPRPQWVGFCLIFKSFYQ